MRSARIKQCSDCPGILLLVAMCGADAETVDAPAMIRIGRFIVFASAAGTGM